MPRDALSSFATFLLASLEAPEVYSLAVSETSAVKLACANSVVDEGQHTVGGVVDGLHCGCLVWVF